MDKHIVTKTGALNVQVCSEGTHDEALEWVKENSPSGTEHNWCEDERPEVAPVKCEQYPERTHYVFTC